MSHLITSILLLSDWTHTIHSRSTQPHIPTYTTYLLGKWHTCTRMFSYLCDLCVSEGKQFWSSSSCQPLLQEHDKWVLSNKHPHTGPVFLTCSTTDFVIRAMSSPTSLPNSKHSRSIAGSSISVELRDSHMMYYCDHMISPSSRAA